MVFLRFLASFGGLIRNGSLVIADKKKKKKGVIMAAAHFCLDRA